MDQQLKERLIGMIVLVLFAVIFIPMFFTGTNDSILKNKENGSISKESEFTSKLKPMTDSATDLNIENIELEPVVEESTFDQEAPKTNAVGQMNWVVQVGSFSSKDNAEKLNQKVKKAGFRSFVNPTTQNNKIMHQVCLGAEYDEADAKNLLKEIKNKMKLDGIVKKYP